MTGTDPEPNPQVNTLIPLPPQVAKSARLNLSRWRHGFEPRWDYMRRKGWPIRRVPVGTNMGASM
jgi:hypothetical protein